MGRLVLRQEVDQWLELRLAQRHLRAHDMSNLEAPRMSIHSPATLLDVQYQEVLKTAADECMIY